MFVNINDVFDELRKNKLFLDWKNKNKGAYLVSVFFMSDNPNELQFDFYDKEKDLITSFSIKDNKVEVVEGSEVLKEKGKIIEPISEASLSNVLDINKAFERARSVQAEHYKKDVPFKTIMALQNLDDYGLVWNITFITHTFKVLNIKLSADSGVVLKHELNSIFDFRK